MNNLTRFILCGAFASVCAYTFGMQSDNFVREYRGVRIVVVRHADITQQHVDAIVNAAQPALTGGGGIDGAIHGAAGPELFNYCNAMSQVVSGERCPTGMARITPAFQLNRYGIKYIIHTVGPRWAVDPQLPEVENPAWRALLQGAYQNSLNWVLNPGAIIDAIGQNIPGGFQRNIIGDGVIRTIAIPAISTGIYGCPIQESTQIAMRAVRDWIDAHEHNRQQLQEIRFVVFSNNRQTEEQNFNIYVQELQALFPAPQAKVQPQLVPVARPVQPARPEPQVAVQPQLAPEARPDQPARPEPQVAAQPQLAPVEHQVQPIVAGGQASQVGAHVQPVAPAVVYAPVPQAPVITFLQNCKQFLLRHKIPIIIASSCCLAVGAALLWRLWR